MRGYFGIGVEGISKAANAGALYRTAHAFGASFVFTVGAAYVRGEGETADTSKSTDHLPLYDFAAVEDLRLPDDCSLIGVELLDDAVDLPSFRHPTRAAYVLGPERGGLSAELVDLCDRVVKIPTRFSINVGLAGALVMYDRTLSLGRFAPRPVQPGAEPDPLPLPEFGAPIWEKIRKRRGRGE